MSGGSAYRDPRAATRAHVLDLQRIIAETEARVLPAFYEALPPDDAARLRVMRGELALEASPNDATMEQLVATEQRLDQYRAALEAWIAHVPDLEDSYRSAGNEAPDPWADVVVGDPIDRSSPRRLEPAARYLHTLLARVDERATVHPVLRGEADGTFVARFRFQDAPYALGLHVSDASGAPDFDLRLATSVARGLPPLLVRDSAASDGFWRELFDRDENNQLLDLDDMEFSGMLRARGRPGAEVLLGARARALLLQLTKYDMPRLDVKPPSAVLSWRFEPQRPILGIAISVLASLRAAVGEVPELLRGVE